MRRLSVAVVLIVLVVTVLSKADSTSLGDNPATFDQQIDAAYLTHNVAFLAANVADDARFTHYGGSTVWNKLQWLEAARTYGGLARNVDSVEVERHGDVVETIGHIQVKTPRPQNPEYHVYFVRLYSRQTGGWQFLSHRTIREVGGPLPPFVGTWKLDLGKSKFPTGVPRYKSATEKIETQDSGIRYMAEVVDAEGKTTHLTVTYKFDGKDNPVTGDPSVDMFASTRIDENTSAFVVKKDGKEVGNGQVVVSKDGKTKTVTQKGKIRIGEDVTTILFYDRQ